MKPFSCLREGIDFYLESRRRWGFALRSEGPTLHSLGRYAEQLHQRGPLTAQLALDWAAAPGNAAPLWRARRLAAAGRLARFLVLWEPRTELPPTGVFGPCVQRGPVHLYTVGQIAQMAEAAQGLEPVGSLRAATFATFWGLLACTGLRVGEALRLQDQDLDRAAATLTIRRSKFGHSRCLPLQASAVRALSAYQKQRQERFPAPVEPSFFLTHTGRRLSYSQAWKTFHQLRGQLRWSFSPAPRLYDLRHTFAVERLLSWYRHGEARVDQKIHTLATYLGHRHIRETYWYLSAVPELLALGSQRLVAAWDRAAGGAHA